MFETPSNDGLRRAAWPKITSDTINCCSTRWPRHIRLEAFLSVCTVLNHVPIAATVSSDFLCSSWTDSWQRSGYHGLSLTLTGPSTPAAIPISAISEQIEATN